MFRSDCMIKLSLVSFLFWPRPFRSSERLHLCWTDPFVLTNGNQRSGTVQTGMNGMNGLSSVHERAMNGLETVQIPFVPVLYRWFLNGIWTVRVKNGQPFRSPFRSAPFRTVGKTVHRPLGKNRPSLLQGWSGQYFNQKLQNVEATRFLGAPSPY